MSDKEILLGRIVRHLMLHTSFTDNLGLLNGKTGVAIFFYKYSRHTGKQYYSDFADELIDEIYKEIHNKYTNNFGDGLAGICWGFEYIIRNSFVDADVDEILEDIDPPIWERDVRKVKDVSLKTGLDGLAHYVLARCSGKEQSPIPHQYIAELQSNMQNCSGNEELIIQLDRLLNRCETLYDFDLIDRISANSNHKKRQTFDSCNIGIADNGPTGIALKLINDSI